MVNQFRSYLADIKRDAGGELYRAAALVFAGALVEGFGILAILPFAALITGNADTEAARWILSAMNSAGIVTELGRGMALGGIFLAILALRGLIVWQRDLRLAAMGLYYVDGLRNRLFRAIAGARWSAVSDLRRTDIEHAITSDIARLSSGTRQLLTSTAAVAIALVQIGLVAWLAPGLLLLVCGLLAVALLVTWPLVRNADTIGKKLTRSGRRLHNVLGDFMATQKLARLNNAEEQFLTRFDDTIVTVRSEQLRFQRSQVAARLGFQFAAGVVVIAALLIGFFVLNTPLAVLAVTLVVLARLTGPILNIAQTGQALANMLPAYGALQDTLARLDHDRDADRTVIDSDAHLRLSAPPLVSLRGITFQHSGQVGPVLCDAALHIQPGEVVALSGSSGAGKTTLLDVLCGLHNQTAGSLHIGERVLAEDADFRWWRSHIAYLPQDPFLFDASLRQNLTWSAPAVSEADIWQALKAASAAHLVKAMPKGLDSRAGERGQALSGGERQRLCIARALLREPRLLILDEATNALDAALEDEILSRLTTMRDQFSILMVTHRIDTLRHADRILQLHDGVISEQKRA